MKRTLVLLSLIISGFLSANGQQSNFTISGKIGHLNAPAKVYLDYNVEGKTVSDSCQLADGAFKFSGHLTGNVFNFPVSPRISVHRGNRVRDLGIGEPAQPSRVAGCQAR